MLSGDPLFCLVYFRTVVIDNDARTYTGNTYGIGIKEASTLARAKVSPMFEQGGNSACIDSQGD